MARGFSLVELVVALAIALVVTGGAFTALQAGYGRFGAETEASDAEQRLRVAADALFQDLVGAAAIVPARLFPAGGDPPGTFRTDVVTAIALVDTAAITTIAEPLPALSAAVRINAGPGCPVGDVACGFAPGDTLVVRDAAGGFDPFGVTAVSGASLALVHLTADGASVYPPGATIGKAMVRAFFLDVDPANASGRLVRQDAAGSVVPVVDGVEDLAFEYFTADGLAVHAGMDPRGIRRIGVRLRLTPAAGDRVARVTVAPRNFGWAP